MSKSASDSASANAAPPVPKPIRFVTNNDGPYAKRRRIVSACLTCRRKKTRCSGERPACGTCKQNKNECAGYGTENDHGATEAAKEVRKAQRRGSNVSSRAPAPKPRHGAAQPPPRRPLWQGTLTTQASAAHPRLQRPNIEGNTGLSLSTRNRMPYFRYFGPTAIMPGFKQMVVKVGGKQHGTHTSSEPIESSPGHPQASGSNTTGEFRTPLELPIYDTSDVSPSPLITHLCQLFLVHLGCSFPFLQRERFMRDLEEKQVDAILVDAVCALAARFSTHPLLTGSGEHQKDGSNESSNIQPSEYGQAFAQRARSAIMDAFPCPSVAVVQAALLLAYDEFGASRDSGLWMYLGIAIRMAQDLGMQTLEGLKYEGRDGPTPSSVKTDPSGSSGNIQGLFEPQQRQSGTPEEEEQRAVERERLDTFWSIFFLDRVISSGTGRPVTLRDADIEISFPSMQVDSASGWPLPFPALIRVVHLYGRVTDLLNSIKEKAHITEELRKKLDMLEYQLTEIYQGLSPKLHFNALNFQHYVKINQGTNFLLLHCWFHTLIVLLHQPTLLKTFEGSVPHLSSNSRELSMSSAKTVADILAFTDLIDPKTGVGNPFTSQPIYIVACAFLKETALHTASSQPHSGPSTPGSDPEPSQLKSEKQSLDHLDFDNPPQPTRVNQINDYDQKQAQKHTVLASAANQNYQRCYRALKSLETYWAGVKYILTVLDQKAKGVGDPLLYTREEMESALEVPRPEPSFTSPGWRRKLSWGTYLTAENVDVDNAAKVTAAIRKGARTPTIPGSPLPPPSQAIGWSLTGTINSPSTNVAVMYTSDASNNRETKAVTEATQASIASVISNTTAQNSRKKFRSPAEVLSPSPFRQTFDPTIMPPPPSSSNHNFNAVSTTDPVLVSDADLLLNLHSPFSANSPNGLASSFSNNNPSSHLHAQNPDYSSSAAGNAHYGNRNGREETFGDMVIDSQDIDMSALGADMMPWDLEYLPHDLMFYGDGDDAGVFGGEEQDGEGEEGE